jgi:hypothetical protein
MEHLNIVEHQNFSEQPEGYVTFVDYPSRRVLGTPTT